MKKIVFIAFMVTMVMGCSEDFKVGAPYKEVMAVYGILSKTDTAHYIKVLKGYYDETQDNLLIAQKTDSIYFNNLEVKIEELNSNTVSNTFILDKVDLVNEGYIKEPGVFAATPNIAYKLKTNLNPNRDYRLIVKNLTTGKEVNAITSIISDNAFNVSFPLSVFDRLNFQNYSQNYNFVFYAPQNAAFFDIIVNFVYQEKNVFTQEVVKKTKELVLLRNVQQTGGKIFAPFRSEEFFRILNSEIGAAPQGIARYIDTPDVHIVAGGQVLKTYIEVTTAQGGGITYDQIKPFYTNLVGENVYGLFSTRVIKRVPTVPFGEGTIDSIVSGVYTKSLNFVGVTPD